MVSSPHDTFRITSPLTPAFRIRPPFRIGGPRHEPIRDGSRRG